MYRKYKRNIWDIYIINGGGHREVRFYTSPETSKTTPVESKLCKQSLILRAATKEGIQGDTKTL